MTFRLKNLLNTLLPGEEITLASLSHINQLINLLSHLAKSKYQKIDLLGRN